MLTYNAGYTRVDKHANCRLHNPSDEVIVDLNSFLEGMEVVWLCWQHAAMVRRELEIVLLGSLNTVKCILPKCTNNADMRPRQCNSEAVPLHNTVCEKIQKHTILHINKAALCVANITNTANVPLH